MTSTRRNDRIARIGALSPVVSSDMNTSALVSVVIASVLACNGAFVAGGVQRARQRCADELAKGNYFPGCPIQTERF